MSIEITELPTMGEYRPKCPNCESINFVAIENRSVLKADSPVGMVICANLACQTVVGVVPKGELWKDYYKNS